MVPICLALLAGGYALYSLATLPSPAFVAAVSAVSAAGIAFRRTRTAAACLIGFCVAWQSAHSMLADRLPPALEDRELVLTGVVSGFPERRGHVWRFVLDTRGERLPARVRLSWYARAAPPRAGETWTVAAKLARPRGFANPTGFDYEEWLFRQGIGATGYVVDDPRNRRLQAALPLQARLRRHVASRIRRVAGTNDASAVLQAITVGARNRITRSQWDRFAATGTSHLMAISGMHVGLAALGAWLIVRLVSWPFCRWLNLRDAATVAAALTALAYASLSGFAVPARRATLMALMIAGAALLRREPLPARLVAAAAIGVFVSTPAAILAPGFKLSFAAVAILLWSARQRRGDDPRDGLWGRLLDAAGRLPPLQICLLLGLMPLTALSFGRVAWLAPLVNLAVLPLFNLIALPAALLGAVFDGPLHALGDLLLRISWHAVRAMLALIAAAADRPAARVHLAIAAPMLLPLVVLAALWAALPPGWPGRRLAWVAAAAALTWRPAVPPRGCVDLTVLDVGQGLAAVLQTRRKSLVFDTGPAFRSGGDTGELVLVPWLRARGIRHVDLLVVSHADSDHAGGAASLIPAIGVGRIVAGSPLPDLRLPVTRCRRGQAWLWDGVRFAFVHPGPGSERSDNDRSCVLEVAAGRHRALLTGDIEAGVERRLLRAGALSPAELVVVPHHGSATSSGSEFVSRLEPEVAVFSVGHGNRWNLPDAGVVRRWARAGARIDVTATSGALRYRLCSESGLRTVRRHRAAARRLWQEPAAP